MTKINLEDIRIDGGTQPRVEIDENLVAEYAEDMQDGDQFPPITLFNDGVKYWLADGFHRYFATKKVGYLEINAEVESGTKRDAILYSVGVNGNHGKRRSNEDKRKAVLTLINDNEWSQWSSREIARKCNVSIGMVSKYRNNLTDQVDQSQRVGADGRTINTSGISESNKERSQNHSDLDDPRDYEPQDDSGYDVEENEERDFVHRNTKIPEDQKELCPCCGQVLPDHMQIQPDRRRSNTNNNVNFNE
jgi:transcriptional regulator with XRE-family HTH domain